MSAQAASPRTTIVIASGLRLVLTARPDSTMTVSLTAKVGNAEIGLAFACTVNSNDAVRLTADDLWVRGGAFDLHGKRDAVRAFLVDNAITFTDEGGA